MKKRITLMLFFAATFFSACSESEGFGSGDMRNKNPFRNHSNAIVLHWNATVFETLQDLLYLVSGFFSYVTRSNF